MRVLALCLLVLAVLAVGCTGRGATACTENGNCKSWEFCNLSAKTCALLPGYCSGETDCTQRDELMTCDLASTHLCVFKEGRCRTNANCDRWQSCSSNQTCRAAPGFCDSDGQCDPAFEFCNPAQHKCGPAPGYCVRDLDCSAWEKCDVVSKKCYLLEGRCNLEGDCENWQTCSLKEAATAHNCVPKKGFCMTQNDCDLSWSKCDDPTHKCIARQGFCGADNECNPWEYCGLEKHTCAPNPDRCNIEADCGNWQLCDSGHYCKARLGFCNTRTDCITGEICNQATHRCE
jgi:hypothetical protein